MQSSDANVIAVAAPSMDFDVVIVGARCAGAATALLVQDLGAEVVVMDHVAVERPGMTTISVDLGNEASIDAAVDALVWRPDLVAKALDAPLLFKGTDFDKTDLKRR